MKPPVTLLWSILFFATPLRAADEAKKPLLEQFQTAQKLQAAGKHAEAEPVLRALLKQMLRRRAKTTRPWEPTSPRWPRLCGRRLIRRKRKICIARAPPCWRKTLEPPT